MISSNPGPSVKQTENTIVPVIGSLSDPSPVEALSTLDGLSIQKSAQGGTQQFGSVSALRTAASSLMKSAVVTFLAGAGATAGMMNQAVAYVQNPSDTTSVDDGSNIITAGDGTRFWRVIQGDTYKVIGMVNDGNTTQTDNSPTLQAGVNFAVYFLKGMPITMPLGAYALNSSVNLGYGINRNDGNTGSDPYTQVVLRGSGFANPAGYGFGTQLIYTGVENVPVFALSGGRMCVIENFALQNKTIYPTTIGLDASWNVQNSWQQSTWINPSWNANATTSTAPFCGIAIDPYTWTAPSGSGYTDYPNVVFPTGIFDASFYTSPFQYSKAASSFVELNRLKIVGFHVGVCLAPGLGTGQTDFVSMRKVWINDCTYAFSSNGSNPRECSIIECYFNQCFKALTTGLNNPVENGGAFCASIKNSAFDRNIYIFDFLNVAEQYTRPIEFDNCYGENCWALGFYGHWNSGSATDDQAIGFTKGSFTFNHTGVRGVPWRMLEMTPYSGLTINGTNFKGYSGCFFIHADNQRCAIFGQARFKMDADPSKLYEKIARNGTNGAILFGSMNNGGFGTYNSKFTGYNTSGTSTPTVGKEHMPCSVTQPAPWYASSFFGSVRANMATNPRLATSFGKSGFTSMVRDANALTWTFTWAVARDWYKLAFYGYGVGDYLIDLTSGTVFVVWKSTTAAVYVKQVNNYAPISGDYPALNTIHTDTSTYGSEGMLAVNTRMFTPGTCVFGTPNSGANTVNCYDASGNTANVPTALPAASALPTGCKAVALWCNPVVDNTFHPSGSSTTTQATDAAAITDTTGGVLTLKKLSDLTTAIANFSAGDAVKRQITLAALVLSDSASA